MIDIHCHILSGIDDGAKDLAISIEMAKLAVADGAETLVATPHFKPGMYDTTMAAVITAAGQLQKELNVNNIPLKVFIGGDLHITPDLLQKLQSKAVPTIASTRYFLFEPPHHILPPGLLAFAKHIMDNGYIPVLTHPERLSWIEQHYDVICKLDELGIPIQLTSMSITGEFGKRPKYWSDRLLDERRVDLIASDAHNIKSRPPGLKKACDVINNRLGEEVAQTIVFANPNLLLADKPLIAKPTRSKVKNSDSKKSIFSYLHRRQK